VVSLGASALDLVVQLRRVRGGGRIVEEIGLLDRAGEELRVVPVWSVRGGVAGAAPRLAGLLAARGVAVPRLLI
jgi:hypothetical protein